MVLEAWKIINNFDMINTSFIRSLIAVACVGMFATQLVSAESLRERLSLDANWRFHFGDIPLDAFPGGQGIAPYGSDLTYNDSKTGHAWGAAARGFADKNWRVVNLPHDWAVEQAFDPKAQKQEGYRPRGIGWYRRTFKLDPSDHGKNIELEFDGVVVSSHASIEGVLCHF